MQGLGTMAEALKNIRTIPKSRQYSINTNDRYEPLPANEDQPKRKMPPLVIPKEHPRKTMERMLTEADRKAIAELLVKFRKSTKNWEEWRAKNWPNSLGDKWADCMAEIRKNGYINPQVLNGQIVFSQIITHRKVETDECTMCGNRFEDCVGEKATKEAIRNGRYGKEYVIKTGDFVSCWKRRNQ